MKINWSEVKVFIKPGVTDFRKQINGLASEIEEEFGNYEDAIKVYESIKRYDKIALLYEKIEDWYNAGVAWRFDWEWENAIKRFTKSGNTDISKPLQEFVNRSKKNYSSISDKQLLNALNPKELIAVRYGNSIAANTLNVNNSTQTAGYGYTYNGSMIITNERVIISYYMGNVAMRAIQKDRDGVISFNLSQINSVTNFSPTTMGKLGRTFSSQKALFYEKVLINYKSDCLVEIASSNNDEDNYEFVLSYIEGFGKRVSGSDAFTILTQYE